MRRAGHRAPSPVLTIEEFAIILPNTRNVTALAELIRKTSWRELRTPCGRERREPLTVSISVVKLFSGDESIALIARAESRVCAG